MHKIGFIWDIDGVVVDSPHEMAWRETVMQDPWSSDGLTSEFYFKHVASRPRYEGGHNILLLLGIYDKLGAETEDERKELLHRFCTQKNNMIQKLISEGRFKIFTDAVRFLLEAKALGIPMAAASASKNATAMLKKVDKNRIIKELGEDFNMFENRGSLMDMFDVDACGLDLGSKEKIQEFAGNELKRLYPEIKAFAVFEDAPSGIKAAKNLGYFAVGVYRLGTVDDLRCAGADLIVDDLSKLDIKEFIKKIIGDGL